MTDILLNILISMAIGLVIVVLAVKYFNMIGLMTAILLAGVGIYKSIRD